MVVFTFKRINTVSIFINKLNTTNKTNINNKIFLLFKMNELSDILRLPNDLIINIALELDLPDLIKWCSINKKFNNITCNNDTFWMNRYHKDFGQIKKPTWKTAYITTSRFTPEELVYQGIKYNDIELIGIGLNRGYNINYPGDTYGIPPLLFASEEKSSLKTIKYLVEQGADIRVDDYYPLYMYAATNRLDVVKYLHEQGSDINAVQSGYHRNTTPLVIASGNGHLEVVKYLVEQGAGPIDQAINLARFNDQPDVVEYLNSAQ